MKQKNDKPQSNLSKSITCDFKNEEHAKRGYDFACDVIENKFLMDSKELVKREGMKVTVPEWFPYEPNMI